MTSLKGGGPVWWQRRYYGVNIVASIIEQYESGFGGYTNIKAGGLCSA